jgi:DNA-binding NarL/FixJ family response regulator
MTDVINQAPSPSRPIRVVILEDQLYAARGIQIVLESQGGIEVVGCIADHTEMLDLVARSNPNVALVDLKLSGNIHNGIRVVEQLTASHPGVKCIVLTSFPEIQHFLACVKAGAKAFVSKDADPNVRPTLPELVRTVVKGGRYYDPELVEQMAVLFPEDPRPADRPHDATDVQLTPREIEVLELLVAKKSNHEIGETLVISPNTVKTHVSSICAKLGADDRHQAALIGIARGLVARPEEDTGS